MELNYIITYRIICNILIILFTSFNSVSYLILLSAKSLSLALYIIIDLFFKLSPLISEIFLLIVFLIVLSILSNCLDVISAYVVLLLLFFVSIISIFMINSSIFSLSLIIVSVLFSKICLILPSNNSFI